MTGRSQCLCLLSRTAPDGSREVLLGRKLTGFGTGKIMTPGGHVEPGETAMQAAVREVLEETGLRVAAGDARRLGTLAFTFPTRPDWDAVVTVFAADRWTGQLVDSAEISCFWCDAATLPIEEMWDDDQYWLPGALAGEAFDAVFVYADDSETVARADVRVASADT